MQFWTPVWVFGEVDYFEKSICHEMEIFVNAVRALTRRDMELASHLLPCHCVRTWQGVVHLQTKQETQAHQPSGQLVLDLDIPGCRTWKRKCLCFNSPHPIPLYGNFLWQKRQGTGAMLFQLIRSKMPVGDLQTPIRSVRLFLWKVTSTRRLHCCCNFLWKHVRKSLWLWIYPASHQRVVHWSLHPIKVSWLQPVSQWYLLQGDLVFLSLLCFPCPVSVRENKLSNHFLAVWAVREVGQGTSLFAVLWGVVLGGWGPAAAAGREEGIWFPCGHSGLISGVSFWEDGSP